MSNDKGIQIPFIDDKKKNSLKSAIESLLFASGEPLSLQDLVNHLEEKNKLIEVAQFLKEGEYEIEDLIPAKSIIQLIDRMYRAEQYFDDFYEKETPIVNQIEAWATKNNLILKDGWKVELARGLQNRFDKEFETVDESIESSWSELFNKFLEEV